MSKFASSFLTERACGRDPSSLIQENFAQLSLKYVGARGFELPQTFKNLISERVTLDPEGIDFSRSLATFFCLYSSEKTSPSIRAKILETVTRDFTELATQFNSALNKANFISAIDTFLECNAGVEINFRHAGDALKHYIEATPMLAQLPEDLLVALNKQSFPLCNKNRVKDFHENLSTATEMVRRISQFSPGVEPEIIDSYYFSGIRLLLRHHQTNLPEDLDFFLEIIEIPSVAGRDSTSALSNALRNLKFEFEGKSELSTTLQELNLPVETQNKLVAQIASALLDDPNAKAFLQYLGHALSRTDHIKSDFLAELIATPLPKTFSELVGRTIAGEFLNLTQQDLEILLAPFAHIFSIEDSKYLDSAVRIMTTLSTSELPELCKVINLCQSSRYNETMLPWKYPTILDLDKALHEGPNNSQRRFSAEFAIVTLLCHYIDPFDDRRLFVAEMWDSNENDFTEIIKHAQENNPTLDFSILGTQLREYLEVALKSEACRLLPEILFSEQPPSAEATGRAKKLFIIMREWALPGMPFEPESVEKMQAHQETSDLMRRAISLNFGFGAHAVESRWLSPTIAPMFTRFFMEHGSCNPFWKLDRDTFPGRGFFGTLRSTDIFPQDLMEAWNHTEDKFKTFKDKVVPWAANEVDLVDATKYFAFRGFIGCYVPNFEGHTINQIARGLIVFNEHFFGEEKRAYLVPSNRLGALEEFLSLWDFNQGTPKFLESPQALLNFLCPNPSDLIDLTAISALGGGLAFCFSPQSSPYFDWEKQIDPRNTKDIFGHTHPSHITGINSSTWVNSTEHPDYAAMLKAWPPLQDAHKQVYHIANSLMNIWDLKRIGMGYYHRGQTSSNGFGFELVAESELTTEIASIKASHDIKPSNYNALRMQGPAFRMLDEAYSWLSTLNQKSAPVKDDKILVIGDLWEANPKITDQSTWLDTETREFHTPNGNYQLSGKTQPSLADQKFWLREILNPILNNPGIDLRFFTKAYLPKSGNNL
jgi:hypothetical protein